MLDTQTMQRVRSHGARIDRFAFQIADRFLDAFFARCPHLRLPAGRFGSSPDVQRRRVAHRWAWFVRRLGELDRQSPELEALAAWLAARGVRSSDFAAARAALLEALRDQCGSDWTDRHEADWGAAFDACAAHLGSTGSQSPNHAPGYALAA